MRLTPGAQALDVTIATQDERGQPLPVRMSITDAWGHPYPDHPDSVLMSHSALGGYFYTPGTVTLDLPFGVMDIVAGRGFEWRPAHIRPFLWQDTLLVVTLPRVFDLPSRRWYAADPHVHTLHGQDIYEITPEDANLLARCEGLSQMFCLDDDYHFTGGPDPVSDSEAGIYYTTEYRNMAMGHCALLGLRELIGSSCCWPPDPVCPLLCDVREIWQPRWDEALSLAHPRPGADFFDDDEWPGIGLARELPVLAAHGYLDAIEVLEYTNVPDVSLHDWHGLLNCGLRIPPSAGTDVGVGVYDKRPCGGFRVYVREEPGVSHSVAQWITGLKAGRCFVTNYPLIPEFSVNGCAAGDVLQLAGPTAELDVHLRIESVLELEAARLIWNRSVVRYLALPPSGGEPVVVDTTLHVSLSGSGWLALRVDGQTDLRHAASPQLFAHTGPVYVHLDGEAVRRTADAARFLDWIDTLQVYVEGRDNWAGEEQHQQVLARLEGARDVYRELFRVSPDPFDLRQPLAGDSLDLDLPLRFKWAEAGDPEFGDRVSYCVEVDADSLFSAPLVLPAGSGTEVEAELPLSAGVYWWRVRASDRGLNETLSTPPRRWFAGYLGTADVAGARAPLGAGIRATQRLLIWPNPSHGRMQCRLDPGVSRACDLEIVDVRGACLARSRAGAGLSGAPVGETRWERDRFSWDGRGPDGRPVPSGIYWVRLRERIASGEWSSPLLIVR